MRLLTGILLIGSALWGGYWFIGERAVQQGILQWLETSSSPDLRIQFDDVDTTGFPNRFDTTITKPGVDIPASAFGWTAPFIQIFALSYKPNQIIAVFANQQEWIINGAPVAIQTEDMRASVVVRPSAQIALDRVRFSITNLTAFASEAKTTTIERVFIASRQSAVQSNAHDVAGNVSGITLVDQLRNQLNPDGSLPTEIDGFSFDATLEFTDAISLRKLDPILTGVSIKKARIKWADLSLSITGELTSDSAGYAAGNLTLESRNWRETFAVLARAGLLDPIWEGALAPMAEADGNLDDLVAPLTLSGGLIYFGPLPLGVAPRLN